MANTATTKAELVAAVAEKVGMTKAAVEQVWKAFVTVLYASAKKNKEVTVPDLGKLVVKKQAARTGRNPQTGAEIKIAAKNVLKFKVAKAAKDAVL